MIFKNGVKKDGVNEFVVDVANSRAKNTFMMSRVVLCANLLGDIRSAEIDNKIKVDRLYCLMGTQMTFLTWGAQQKNFLTLIQEQECGWDHMYREYTPNFDKKRNMG